MAKELSQTLWEMLVSNNRYAETVDDDGKPTPVTITGAQRRCAIDTQPNPKIGCPDGIYGNAFEIATEEHRLSSLELVFHHHPQSLHNGYLKQASPL